MLNVVPSFEMPKRVKRQKVMKGRPITAEEYERMLAKVEAGLVLTATSRVNPKRQRQLSETAMANRAKRLAEGAVKAGPHWLRFLRWL